MRDLAARNTSRAPRPKAATASRTGRVGVLAAAASAAAQALAVHNSRPGDHVSVQTRETASVRGGACDRRSCATRTLSRTASQRKRRLRNPRRSDMAGGTSRADSWTKAGTRRRQGRVILSGPAPHATRGTRMPQHASTLWSSCAPGRAACSALVAITCRGAVRSAAQKSSCHGMERRGARHRLPQAHITVPPHIAGSHRARRACGRAEPQSEGVRRNEPAEH